jgi:drug/metabolite transporter (DMT)-like permease
MTADTPYADRTMQRRGPMIWPALALAAAVLAAIPLVLSRLDGDSDLDPFFLVLVMAALAVAILMAQPAERRVARLAARGIALAWLATGVVIAVLLGMYQTACGCSRVEPSSLPPVSTWAGLPATAFHLLATYGGGTLVAIAAFGARERRPRQT